MNCLSVGHHLAADIQAKQDNLPIGVLYAQSASRFNVPIFEGIREALATSVAPEADGQRVYRRRGGPKAAWVLSAGPPEITTSPSATRGCIAHART